MSKVILLDTGPLGFLTNPRATPETEECSRWMQGLLLNGVHFLVPEIVDYEHRRGLLRVGKGQDIAKLDDLEAKIGYDPITTDVMRRTAEFWAEARKMGYQTADDRALDGDMILCGHAEMLSRRGHNVTIATTNVKHLELFTVARRWQDIP